MRGARMDEPKSIVTRVVSNCRTAVAPQTESTLEKPLTTGAAAVPRANVFGQDVPSSSEPDSGLESSEEETYPEGGWRAWLVVLGSWLALFASLGIMNTMATLQSYVATHQLAEYDTGTIGWIFSLFIFLCFFLGIYIGPIFDKFGPRWPIFSGTVCFTLGLMLLSICSKLWHFVLAFGVLCGTGASLLFTPSIAAVGHYFYQHRGLATGVASTAGSLGGIVFPLLIQGLLDKVGWGWAIRSVGFVCLAFTAVSNLLIRSRLPPAENASAHPNLRIFKNKPFLLTTIAVFLLEFGLFLPVAYISSYALSKGFSQDFALRLPTILNTGSFVGRILPGYYADKIGAFNANIISVALSIVACFAVWLPAGHTTPGIIIFALLFGFASGSNISLIPVSIGRLCKTQHYGRYYATCYTVVSIACLIDLPIGGQIVKAGHGDYLGLIIITAAVYSASFIAFAAAKIYAVGWQPWAKF